MAIAKIEFLWYKPGDKIKEEEECYVDKWTKLGYIDLEEKPVVEEPKVDGDLNNDGVFDKEDKSIAGKVLAKGRKKK